MSWYLDNETQAKAKACLDEMRIRWSEMYPKPNSREKSELKRLYLMDHRPFIHSEGKFIFRMHECIGKRPQRFIKREEQEDARRALRDKRMSAASGNNVLREATVPGVLE